MACQYYVNGSWVSESEFKELLNNGLLDNLISDKTLDLKGFKVDKSKLLKKETVEVTRDTIPAQKLAGILANEIKNRQGYPDNMLAALELNVVKNPDGSINEDLTDFKIPLWASPYATKFESLLTSLVTNKVIKQKLPGGSYVLGSPEGFKFQKRVLEGEAAEEYIGSEGLKSQIVFNPKYDLKDGLLPMRWDPENKKMLPAQIMIPFKFRDEAGNILDLKQFTIRTEDGRVILDTEKIPEKLLQLFGFRIPTQKQNSMSALEIVGFLPESVGDLILAPRDFTKQMGSDFDVDKLYTYSYNHFYQDGKLFTNFIKDKNKIEVLLEKEKEILESLKEELKLTKTERKLLDTYLKQKLDTNDNGDEFPVELVKKAEDFISRAVSQDLLNQINNSLDRISILNRSFKASRQNNILDIHLKVITSSNPEVIRAVMELDSSGEFKTLSEDVDKIRKDRGLVQPVTTILSETYQRTKFINATAGKDGVGSFSLDSTFNSIAQGKNLVILNLNGEQTKELFGDFLNPKVPTTEQILEKNNPIAIFGDNVSIGNLSDKYTLRSRRIINNAKAQKRELTQKEIDSLKLKSGIIRALQSSAVDNEKEQILDKLNINNETFDAIRALTILGFEENEIVGLLTQEIVWEYIDKLQSSRSSLTTFTRDIEQVLFQELVKKYDPEGKYSKLTEEALERLQSGSAEQLMDNIKNKTLKPLIDGDITPDFNLEQLALLEKFIRISEQGKEIKVLQSTINSDSKGVPKSLIETAAKVNQVEKLGSSNIFNASSLLSNSLSGFATKYGTEFANTIYRPYFPYYSTGFDTLINEIQQHLPRKITSVSKLTELKTDVFKDIRSFLYSNTRSNLFNDNPDVERRRLFIDKEGYNQSLATRLKMVSNESWFLRNGFLNKLDFDLNKNGDISRINFEAAAAENYDERNIYDGFNYLLANNFTVGTFLINGQNVEMTSRMLAQELIAAAYLEGGNQGSKQYLKYVPISYLKVLGFGDYLSKVPFDFIDTFKGNLTEVGPIYTEPSVFTRQYFQNNPEQAKTIALQEIMTNPNEAPKEFFTLKQESLENNFIEIVDPYTGEPTQTQTKFVSIYDNKLPNKYALYEFDEIKRVYRRIETLGGSYGMVQYNSQSSKTVPLQKTTVVAATPTSASVPGFTIPNIPVTPTKDFDVNVVNNKTAEVTTQSLPINRNLSDTKEAIDDLLNTLEDSGAISNLNKNLLDILRNLTLPEKFKVVYANIRGRGGFDATTNVLTVNLTHPANQNINDFATAVLHELIHAHTSRSIQLYEKGKLESLTENQIQAIQRIESLFELYKEQLIEKEGPQGKKIFAEKYADWKAGKNVNITAAEISKYYGAIKLTEFVTMAMSDPGFQEHLNSITDESEKSIWQQLKDLILDLLNSLGLDIKEGSALAPAIKNSLDLINANQEALKNTIRETKEFTEFGTKYKFVVDGNGKVLSAEYAQGNGIFKPMSSLKNAQNAYDRINQPTAAPQAPVSTLGPETKINIYAGTGENAELSNFADRITGYYEVDGFTEIQGVFRTVEGAFQAAKVSYTKDLTKEEQIDNAIIKEKLANVSGAEAKALGRKIKGLDKVSWDANSSRIMKKILLQSFKANPDALAKLLATGNATLTHVGTEKPNRWTTEFPKLLMEVRNELKGTQETPVETFVGPNKYELFPGAYANQGQTEAIDKIKEFLASDERAFLLRGRGGTGKTAIIKKIVESLPSGSVLAIAPNHKPKKVLNSSINADRTSPINTVTLASALAIKLNETTGKFEPNEYARKKGRIPIKKAKYIIIDESSMISDKLLDEINKFTQGAKIIFMGDRAQLPPIGQETDSKVFNLKNNYTLTEIMRQGATSPIIGLGKVVSENVESTNIIANPITNDMRVDAFDPVSGSSVEWVSNEDVALNQFVSDIKNANEDVNFAKIVTFNNENNNSGQSVKNLNIKVRNKLFGTEGAKQQFNQGELLTAYDSFGGEIPIFDNSEDFFVIDSNLKTNVPIKVSAISEAKGYREITLNFDIVYLNLKADDGRSLPPIPVIANSSKQNYEQALSTLLSKDPQMYYALKNQIANLQYGYAVTSHKAQGSTYTNVYVMEDNIMGSSNGGSIKSKNQSLYVAISRPTTKLVMVSTKNTVKPTVPFNIANLAQLGVNPADYTSPKPTGESETPQIIGEDLLGESSISREAIENYLLICGK